MPQIPPGFHETLRAQETMLQFSHVIGRDLQDRILYWTTTDEEIYGWSADEALGQESSKLLGTEHPAPREDLERQAAETGRWEGEIVRRRRGGEARVLSSTLVPYRDETGRLEAFFEINCDITRQKAAEKALRARERDFRTFFELSGVGNVISDAETGHFLTVNGTFCELTGYSSDELLRMTAADLTHPEDRDRDAAGWKESLSRGEPHYTIEKRYVRKNGSEIWVSVTSTIIRGDDGRPLYAAGVIIDVTMRRTAMAETARQFLERAMLDANEREQHRLGEELQEQLCQQLVGAAFTARTLSTDLTRVNSSHAEEAHHLARLLSDSALQARNMARGINPIDIDSGSLMSALQELAARSPKSPSVKLRAKKQVLVQNIHCARQVFRIAQEALANALHHADASEIVISLTERSGIVTLQISDNGRGIPAGASKMVGVGTEIMKYRAQAIGGELTIESPAQSTGTIVTCKFPNR